MWVGGGDANEVGTTGFTIDKNNFSFVPSPGSGNDPYSRHCRTSDQSPSTATLPVADVCVVMIANRFVVKNDGNFVQPVEHTRSVGVSG